MASSHVIVLDSVLKRTQVKVTPGRYMREVLEEACKARKLDPEAYTLKTQNNKTVDLSQPFRLSGLPGGAKLQLVQGSRSATVVNVALQLPESEGGGKLIDKFPSTTSLWLVLRKYEDAVAGQPPKKLNLTQRASPVMGSNSGRLEYEQPCLNIMGRTLETFADLQKTISQLGLSGSAMMRLSFKPSGRPMQEVMQEIEQYFQTSPPASEASAVPSGEALAAGGAAVTSPEENTAADAQRVASSGVAEGSSEPDAAHTSVATDDNQTTPAQPQTQADKNDTSPPNNTLNGISVFRPPSSNTPAAARYEEDAATFEPDIESAKVHQAALQRATKNTRLLSDAELAQQASQREAQIAAIQNVKVRVRYPDQSIIETTISATDSPTELYEKVRATLANASEPFELRFAGARGPHQPLPENAHAQRLIRDFGFRGHMLLTLVWSPGASPQARQGASLKEEYRSRATELKVELASQRETGQESHRVAMAKSESSSAGGSGGKSKGDIEAKMKKFLGFGKK